MNLSPLLTRLTSLACSSVFVFSLSACKNHENPLTKLSAKDVAAWIYEHKTSEIVSCAKSGWSEPRKSTSTDFTCDEAAKDLSSSMKKAGFGDVTPEDIHLGTIWIEFNKRIQADKANHYSAEKTHKIFDSIKIKKPSEKGLAP